MSKHTMSSFAKSVSGRRFKSWSHQEIPCF